MPSPTSAQSKPGIFASLVAVSATHALPLDRGELLCIYDGEGMRLTPVCGVLWITEQDDANDTVLLPGDTYEVQKPGLALVQAHRSAQVVMAVPVGTAPPGRVDLVSCSEPATRLITLPQRAWAFGRRCARDMVRAAHRAFAVTSVSARHRATHAQDGS